MRAPATDSRTTSTPLAPRTGVAPTELGHAHYPVEELVRTAHAVMDQVGVEMSEAKLSRLIRKYRRYGFPVRDFRCWFLTYADPTGEAAVRNVMRCVE